MIHYESLAVSACLCAMTANVILTWAVADKSWRDSMLSESG